MAGMDREWIGMDQSDTERTTVICRWTRSKEGKRPTRRSRGKRKAAGRKRRAGTMGHLYYWPCGLAWLSQIPTGWVTMQIHNCTLSSLTINIYSLLRVLWPSPVVQSTGNKQQSWWFIPVSNQIILHQVWSSSLSFRYHLLGISGISLPQNQSLDLSDHRNQFQPRLCFSVATVSLPWPLPDD